MMRKYRAIYDDGHDYGEFEYYSEYRRNSKKNKEDMNKTFKNKYGYNRFKAIRTIECIGKVEE